MLKIKLARFGKKKQPMYRIVVNEARTKRDGAYVECLGHYSPTENPKVLKIDLEAVKKWIKLGAQPTDTVASLIKRYESGNPFPPKKKKLSKKAKAKLAKKDDKVNSEGREGALGQKPVKEAETPVKEAEAPAKAKPKK